MANHYSGLYIRPVSKGAGIPASGTEEALIVSSSSSLLCFGRQFQEAPQKQRRLSIGNPRFPLKGSFEGGLDIAIDIDIDLDHRGT